MGRLTTSVVVDGAKQATTTQTQTYDAVGNRLTQTVNGSPTQSFSYTATNQVVGWTYDAAGNLLDDGEQTYTWDALSRLVGVDPGNAPTTYTYDGNGVLVQAQTDTLTTTYTQDTRAGLSQMLVETMSVGELSDTRRFWYGADRLAAVGSLGATWLYHDYLGSVRLTKAGGSSAVPLSYDAWGVPTTGTPDPFGFTGELQSSATGLQYLRARWYNPATGTLLGRDPFAGYAEQPYSSHPYQYGYSQPTLYGDPSGELAFLLGIPIAYWLAGAGVAAVAVGTGVCIATHCFDALGEAIAAEMIRCQ